MQHRFWKFQFLTHHNLQGSQTITLSTVRTSMFLTHHNLQGSQTINNPRYSFFGFLPIIIYKVLKQGSSLVDDSRRFLPIIIYKVLKPDSKELFVFACFLPIIIYKVLKQIIRNVACLIVSYPS